METLVDNAAVFDEDYGRWEAALTDGDFEEVFQALEEAVACLESGHLSLERSLSCFELGAQLAARCDQMLANAELRISRLDATLARIGRARDHFDDENEA
jgi:exodeoxyribonuclease VII small subunit